ncbi:hypothetical protein ACO2KH_16280 [Leptospira terpstrae]|uniref:hypothetical protein n=1 Tax=Leptospira terpstrae TaxID=293075 RepID=UPI003CFF693E
MNPNSFLTKSLLYDWIPDFEFISYDLSDLVVLSPELDVCQKFEKKLNGDILVAYSNTALVT